MSRGLLERVTGDLDSSLGAREPSSMAFDM